MQWTVGIWYIYNTDNKSDLQYVGIQQGIFCCARQQTLFCACRGVGVTVYISGCCIYWAVQAGLLTPLIFARHHLSPLVAFTFLCVLSSQWKAVTVNLWILHCQRHFWRPVVRMCLATSNNLLLVLLDAQNTFFSTNLRSSGQLKNDAKTLFFHPPSPFPGNFCNCNSGGICTASQF